MPLEEWTSLTPVTFVKLFTTSELSAAVFINTMALGMEQLSPKLVTLRNSFAQAVIISI
jgi:hypothetical protein